RGLSQPVPVSFAHQVMPLLTKASCNAGGCHGKAEGQNGFKLSVFGFDPASDHDALVKEGRGRRVFLSAPGSSLLLLKATAEIPHGGGRKITPRSPQYRRLFRWIKEGCRFGNDQADAVVALRVEPEQDLLALRGSRQLRVTALTAGGKARCVTAEAEYESNASTIAGVDRRGWVQASDLPGEVAVLVRYMGHVTVCRLTVPHQGVRFSRPAEVNFIDRHVWNKLERLGVPPSGLADDGVFLRRAFLDTIGTLPTVTEARDFLRDRSPAKRARLIDALLERPEYADYWALRWSDLLRVDRDAVTAQGAVAISRWLRRKFAENTPYDHFVRAVITARGDTSAEGPAALYKALDTPEVMARSLSQVFLGVRIECAQCHHHPSERWDQDDYFALAGFFTGVQRKPLPGGGEAIVTRAGTDLNHPRTGKPVPARALGASPADFSTTADRRIVLADWMTADENPYLARGIANRLWAHYFGRGLVEPMDDLRATNPATNEPLLDDLAKHLRDLKYDLKAFTRTLLNSRAYQLSSSTNPENAGDQQNFSHALARTLPAEVLLDAISQATGVPEKFNGWPAGVRAIQVWDNRMPSYFFQIFGRPVRASVCECERSGEPSIAQALHLINSPELMSKVRHRDGLARRLAGSEKSPAEVVDELYLGTLSRFPTEKERATMLDAFADQSEGRRAAVEDVLWTLLNSKQFLYNR
ncbi:MAG TPA: DUF1549 and DUF1553 domain-containing protein, partial [Isosphaeraceae bacterium]|nr:DUF1549 and DUF1553 domain-containing protein [Isosphaeraceae bacterium]